MIAAGVAGPVKRIAFIDYLRAICVIFVIIHHSAIYNESLLDRTGPVFVLFINMAVPVFMLLSGYSTALSEKARTLCEMYEPKKLLRRFLRITIPTVVSYAVFIMLMTISGRGMDPAEIVKRFILGNYGMGSYYYAIVVQMMFIAPLMYYVVRKYASYGVVAIGLCNFFYEICCSSYHLDERIYRVLVFRYLFAAAAGMYMCLYKDKKISAKALTEMLAVGITYMLLPYLWGYENRVFTFGQWSGSSMMCVFYVFPMVYILKDFLGNLRGRALPGLMGRASYHIMYTQMIYFVARPYIDRIIDLTAFPKAAEYAVNIIFSVAMGIVFYKADELLFGRLYRGRRNENANKNAV